MKEFDRIKISPSIHNGRPYVGEQIPVAWIIEKIAAGSTIISLLDEVPLLERDDVVQALQFNADSMLEWIS